MSGCRETPEQAAEKNRHLAKVRETPVPSRSLRELDAPPPVLVPGSGYELVPPFRGPFVRGGWSRQSRGRWQRLDWTDGRTRFAVAALGGPEGADQAVGEALGALDVVPVSPSFTLNVDHKQPAPVGPERLRLKRSDAVGQYADDVRCRLEYAAVFLGGADEARPPKIAVVTARPGSLSEPSLLDQFADSIRRTPAPAPAASPAPGH
ncbi:MAG: hypothetical protein HY744_15755 [Deltaproteobacteria bacterium]|nr:hypothetical protein [Deltaproteobacteria bacterium]